jgi:exodeoxyribonuclease VII large subunit
LDDLQTSLGRSVSQELRQQRLAWLALSDRLRRVRPALALKLRREVFRQAEQRLQEQAHHRLRDLRNRLTTFHARLRLLGPEQVLARGYSITRDAETGKVLRDAKETKPGQRLETRLKLGSVLSRIDMNSKH